MTTPDFGHTTFAIEARTRKAVRVEAALRMTGCNDSVTARALDHKGRRVAEKAAGVRPCSNETWGVVFSLLDSWRPQVASVLLIEATEVPPSVRPVAPRLGVCPACGLEQGDPAPLGAANGPGFGWKDINVIKLGLAWRASADLTLRVGYNRGDNPISASDVTFNILAPGVMTQHYTAGFTYATAKDSEVTAALMIAPRQTVSGPSLFNGFMGGAAGNETIGMRQSSFGLAYSRKF